MKRAFTLIELLVVVAIIAIIAAIAVPNFLEAQTRSKVSRSKADMRTIATALETYRIDSNRYPPDFQFGKIAFVDRFVPLTTPISYLTSIPSDPFANKGKIAEYAAQSGVNGYTSGGTVGGQLLNPLPYDYAQRVGPGGFIEPPAIWRNISSSPSNVIWAMRSAGPDGWPVYLGQPSAAYDPTNGTVSAGNIYWTGPGRGEDQPLSL